MVGCRTQDGKIVLYNSVPIADDAAEQLEAALKANRKQINAMSKDLHMDLWVETNKNGEKVTVAERKFSNESEIDVIEEIKYLRKTHLRFVEAIMGMQKKQDFQSEETPGTHDDEDKKFLNYTLVCKLQELVNSCCAIIIAVPK